MRLVLYAIIFTTCYFNACLLASGPLDSESREKEAGSLSKLCAEYAKFYEMHEDVDLKDITEDLLQSPYVREIEKQLIQQSNRRIFIFTYPSDGLKIKGFISFVPDPENHPLLVLLRGGNRIFGVLNPGSDFSCFDQYTVIATMYRGGVSEGEDEFGGDDVNDVKNLVHYIPELEKKLSLNFQNQKAYLLGGSRGGLQMFLTLARFPELQNRFDKIVSLSGVLDIRQWIAERADIEKMFIDDFGLEKGFNEEEWINKRDPILTIEHIKSDLPILVIQGTTDSWIGLEVGYNMVSKLQLAGKNVTYFEIEGAIHCLMDTKEKIELIRQWLEE